MCSVQSEPLMILSPVVLVEIFPWYFIRKPIVRVIIEAKVQIYTCRGRYLSWSHKTSFDSYAPTLVARKWLLEDTKECRTQTIVSTSFKDTQDHSLAVAISRSSASTRSNLAHEWLVFTRSFTSVWEKTLVAGKW